MPTKATPRPAIGTKVFCQTVFLAMMFHRSRSPSTGDETGKHANHKPKAELE